MLSDISNSVPNYYEYLNVSPQASLSELQNALERLQAKTRERLIHPLTMQQALWMQKTIIPGIKTQLLASPEARVAYDQQLAIEQQRLSMRDQLADNEGLDEELERPFLFDFVDGYDREVSAAFTLREIAHKLDREWEQAQRWITDNTDETHVFVGYLTHVAKRPHLAQRLNEIINAVTPRKQMTSQPYMRWSPMDTNEGIERCITLLDPDIERPTVEICSPTFDGNMLYAGEFIPDQPAQTELYLVHAGIRGCVFGTVRSCTDWIQLSGGVTSIRFSLLPAELGTTQIAIPLCLLIADLPRNTQQIGEILLCLENHPTVQEIPVKLLVTVAPLPPRVSFEPPATQHNPLSLGSVRRGTLVRTVLTARNAGDQEQVPLSGHIFTHKKGVKVSPSQLHANEPITCIVDTSSYRDGKNYRVVLHVEYDQASRALGPTMLYLQGKILPTPWQSMLRKRSFNDRLNMTIASGVAGGLVGLLAGQWAYTHWHGWFLLFLLMPLLLSLLLRWVGGMVITHIQLTGNPNVQLKQIHPLVLWGLPLLTGILFPIICITLPGQPLVILFAGCFCCVLGGIAGFCLD